MSCPSGMLCINYSSIIIFSILIAICIFCIYTYNNNNNNNQLYDKISNLTDTIKSEYSEKKNTQIYENIHERLIETPNTQNINDIYNEPTKNVSGVRVNIPTRGPTPQVQQIGILSKTNFTTSEGPGTDSESHILPLMGRKTYNRSNKWVYYTATDKYNQIKLPISHKGRNCAGEYGCDELMNGDTINIPELNGTFTVKIYENSGLQYIPY